MTAPLAPTYPASLLLIDAALLTLTGRSLVATGEVSDLLLDIRQAITGEAV